MNPQSKNQLSAFFTAVACAFVFYITFTLPLPNFISTNRSPAALQLLSEVSGGEGCSELFAKFFQEETNITYIRSEQSSYLPYMKKEMERFLQRAKRAEKELYTYTAKYAQRVYRPLGKYGVSFDPSTNQTTFSTFGDKELVKSIVLEIYDGADPKTATKVMEQKMTRMDDIHFSLSQTGNMEGKWFRYKVISLSTKEKPVLSQYGEPIPQQFYTYDITGYKSSIYKTAQIYYPPDPALRPKAPAESGTRTIWEINLSDIAPKDVDPSKWGTIDALLESKEMQERMKNFDGIEIMPPRNANMVTPISSNPSQDAFKKDTAYLNHWGYMGKGYDFSERIGGVESIIKLVDMLHLQGKVAYVDHVFQHSANDMKEWQWMVKNAYMDFDRTGCGNTLDLRAGTLPTEITEQIFLRDLLHIGFDGSRQDLFGAIPIETAERLRDLALQHSKRISGEPYGYPYDQSFWNRHNKTLRNARLWDDEGRRALRDIANFGADYKELLARITGGSMFSWKQSANDATVIIETHDGETVAHALGAHPQKVAHLNAIQLSAQGDLLIGPGQPFALVHHELNDTPIEMHKMGSWQKEFEIYFSNLLKTRKRFSHFFNEEWIDPAKGNISYLYGRSNKMIGIHFKKSSDRLPQKESGELIILFNLSEGVQTFQIPEGSWATLVNSSDLKADPKKSLYPLATEGKYSTAPNSTVWLYKKGK